jgi:hypothetical protein
MNVGIIPAAGKSTRFGGVLKELLPAKDGTPFIVHAVNHLRPVCDIVVVVTNKDKIQSHAVNIGGVFFVVQQSNLDILGAVQAAMSVKADRYYLIMPDTFISGIAFDGCQNSSNLSLGTFSTNKVGRFGYIVGNSIQDKSNDVELPAIAWGVLSWSDSLRGLFFSSKSLSDALNSAILGGFEIWSIGDYYDIADVGEYSKYLST